MKHWRKQKSRSLEEKGLEMSWDNWSAIFKCKLYLTCGLVCRTSESRSRKKVSRQRGKQDVRKRTERNRRSFSSCGRRERRQQVQIDQQLFLAHLGDRWQISLGCGCRDKPRCKERFQSQVVVQDHLEQGTLTGWQLRSNKICNTIHLHTPSLSQETRIRTQSRKADSHNTLLLESWTHLDGPLPHDVAQFSDVVVLLNCCSQVTIILRFGLRLSTKRALCGQQEKITRAFLWYKRPTHVFYVSDGF